MLKKSAASTKKPTQLIKSKPTSPQPFKASTSYSSSSSISGSSSSFFPHETSFEHGSASAALSSSATTDGTSFFAPEDVTLPPNSTTDVSKYRSLLFCLPMMRSEELFIILLINMTIIPCINRFFYNSCHDSATLLAVRRNVLTDKRPVARSSQVRHSVLYSSSLEKILFASFHDILSFNLS